MARVQQGSVRNHSKSRGRHMLRLFEVDKFRVLPGRCLMCCCCSSQALLKTPEGVLSPGSHPAHTTPCPVGIPATRCDRGPRPLRRGLGWRRPSA
eukprot:2567389-Pleurochrysis_carterae.AAC.1